MRKLGSGSTLSVLGKPKPFSTKMPWRDPDIFNNSFVDTPLMTEEVQALVGSRISYISV
jgi:hypothetical protein